MGEVLNSVVRCICEPGKVHRRARPKFRRRVKRLQLTDKREFTENYQTSFSSFFPFREC